MKLTSILGLSRSRSTSDGQLVNVTGRMHRFYRPKPHTENPPTCGASNEDVPPGQEKFIWFSPRSSTNSKKQLLVANFKSRSGRYVENTTIQGRGSRVDAPENQILEHLQRKDRNSLEFISIFFKIIFHPNSFKLNRFNWNLLNCDFLNLAPQGASWPSQQTQVLIWISTKRVKSRWFKALFLQRYRPSQHNHFFKKYLIGRCFSFLELFFNRRLLRVAMFRLLLLVLRLLLLRTWNFLNRAGGCRSYGRHSDVQQLICKWMKIIEVFINWKRNLNLKLIFIWIQSSYISFDSAFKTLLKVFWDKHDQMSLFHANSRKQI